MGGQLATASRNLFSQIGRVGMNVLEESIDLSIGSAARALTGSSSLAKKPANGGIPAKENNKINNDKDIIGWFFDKHDKSSKLSKNWLFLFIANKQQKTPKFIIKYIHIYIIEFCIPRLVPTASPASA